MFFNYFEDDNNVIDTSILTKIYGYNDVPKVILLSICNMTDKQIQFITSCKNRYQIIQPWIGKGFPATEEIDKIIENHKKNNTANNSIKHVIIDSTRYSKPQSDSINLTKTKDSYHTAIVLEQKRITNDDISKKTPTFLNPDVSVINPTNSTQKQAETSKILKTNIADRSLTPGNILNTITIKPLDDFSNMNEMLDYFANAITSKYEAHNAVVNYKLIRYMAKKKLNVFHLITREEYYLFFSKLIIFLSVYFKKNYNEIIDIVDTIFYTQDSVYIKKNLIYKFIELTDKQIQELAGNKDLYKSLLIEHRLEDIDFNNIQSFTNSRIKSNKKQEKKLYKFIANSSADDSKKNSIRKRATNIFNICYKKNIDIYTS